MESNKIIFREFLAEDWVLLHALYNRPETVRYNPSGYPESEQATKNMVAKWVEQSTCLERTKYTYLISDRVDNTFIGVISLDLGKVKYNNAEIWYKLEPKKWGRGFATEALHCILNFGFNELNLHRIECGCSIKNVASFKVMEKAGMMREGIKRKLLPLHDGWHDAVMYGILKEKFLDRQRVEVV